MEIRSTPKLQADLIERPQVDLNVVDNTTLVSSNLHTSLGSKL